MSIQFSTPVVGSPSPSGVQEIYAGSGINVINGNSATPTIENAGVIDITYNQNQQGYSDIYIFGSPPQYPELRISRAWGQFYAATLDQYAFAPNTATPLILSGAWNDLSQQIDYSPAFNNISITEGLYTFEYVIRVNNSDTNDHFFSVAHDIDGNIDFFTIAKYRIPPGENTISFTFITRIINPTSNVTLQWATDSLSLYIPTGSVVVPFGTQEQAKVNIIQISATNFCQ